jgi:hypothetical protein
MKQTLDFRVQYSATSLFPTSGVTNFVMLNATVARSTDLAVIRPNYRMSQFRVLSAERFAA